MTTLPLCMIKIIVKTKQIDMHHFVSFKYTKAMVVLKVLLFSLVYWFMDLTFTRRVNLWSDPCTDDSLSSDLLLVTIYFITVTISGITIGSVLLRTLIG